MHKILSFFLLFSLVYTPVHAVFDNKFYPGLDGHMLRKAHMLERKNMTFIPLSDLSEEEKAYLLSDGTQVIQQGIVEKSLGGGGKDADLCAVKFVPLSDLLEEEKAYLLMEGILDIQQAVCESKTDSLLLDEAVLLKALSPFALIIGERRIQTLYQQSSYGSLDPTKMLPHFAAIHIASEHNARVAPGTPITALFQMLFPGDVFNFSPNHCYKDPIGSLKPLQLGTLIRFLTMGYFTLSPSDRIDGLCNILGVNQKQKESPTYIKLDQITPDEFSTAETFVALRIFAKEGRKLWLTNESSIPEIKKIFDAVKASSTPLLTFLTLTCVSDGDVSSLFANVDDVFDAVDVEVFRKVHPESPMLKGKSPEIFRLKGSKKKNLEKSIGDLKRRRMAIVLDKAMQFQSLETSNKLLVQQILATFFGRKFKEEKDLISFYSALLGEKELLDKSHMQTIDAITLIPLLAQFTQNPSSFFTLNSHERSYIIWRSNLELKDQILFQSTARARGTSFPDCVETGLRNAFLELSIKTRETGESYLDLDRIPEGSPARMYFDEFSTLEAAFKESTHGSKENSRDRWACDLSEIPGVTYNQKSVDAEIQSGALSVLNALIHMLGLEELDPLIFNPSDIPAQETEFNNYLAKISSALSRGSDVVEILKVEEFFPNFTRRDYSTELLIKINDIPCSKIHIDHGHTKLTKEPGHFSPLVCSILQAVESEEQALMVAPLVAFSEHFKTISSFITGPSMPIFMNTVDHKNPDMVSYLAVMCLQNLDLGLDQQLYRHLRYLEQLEDSHQSEIVGREILNKFKSDALTLKQVAKIIRAHNCLLMTSLQATFKKEPYRNIIQDIAPSLESYQVNINNEDDMDFYGLFNSVAGFILSMDFLQNFQDSMGLLIQNTHAEALTLTKITNPGEKMVNFLKDLPALINELFLTISSIDDASFAYLSKNVTQFLSRPSSTIEFRFDFDEPPFSLPHIDRHFLKLTEEVFQEVISLLNEGISLPSKANIYFSSHLPDNNSLLFKLVIEMVRKCERLDVTFAFTPSNMGPAAIFDIISKLNQRNLRERTFVPVEASDGIIYGVRSVSNYVEKLKSAYQSAYLKKFKPAMTKVLTNAGFPESKFSFNE